MTAPSRTGPQSTASTSLGPATLSGHLAEFGTGLTLDRVPAEVVAHAKLLTLDTLGAALAGVSTAEGRATIAAIRQLAASDTGPCAVWGTSLRTGRGAAALVNGITAHAQELDDFGGCDHSGAVVVPAVFAACEGRQVSGTRVLEAIIVGYDIALRVLEAAGGYRTHNGRGWHSTGTCGSFGAGAAVAKALGLDVSATMSVLGIAGSFTGGTWAFLADGAMSKRYHPGRAAETGVIAGFLAQEGFTGPTQVFEAEWGGFFRTYAPDTAQPARLTDALGSEFKILRSGVKPYACCRGAHSTLDAVLDIRVRESLTAARISGVAIRCTRDDMQMLGDRNPQTRLAAQMSLPYSVAVALIEGRAFLTEYEERWLTDGDVRTLMAKVEMTVDATLPEGTEPYVSIHTTDGRTYTGHVAHGRGAPENPLPAGDVIAKYEELAARSLPAGPVRRVKEAVLALEEPERVDALFEALRVPESIPGA
jgi:2-methylcitrate dehydratase PrpD